MGGNLGNAVLFEQRPIFVDDVVLHLLKKPNERLTLGGRLFALKNCHEHIDALLRKSEGKFSCSTSL
jgi:hypothetical protein